MHKSMIISARLYFYDLSASTTPSLFKVAKLANTCLNIVSVKSISRVYKYSSYLDATLDVLRSA